MVHAMRYHLGRNGEALYSFQVKRDCSPGELYRTFYHDGLEPIIKKIASLQPSDNSGISFYSEAYLVLVDELKRWQQLSAQYAAATGIHGRQQRTHFTDEDLRNQLLDAIPH